MMIEMAKLVKVSCPCCQAELQIDPELQSVITFKEHEKPREVADIEVAMNIFKGEKQRRDDAFEKSVNAEKNKKQLLDRKFDELFKQAKESPSDVPPKRNLDWD